MPPAQYRANATETSAMQPPASIATAGDIWSAPIAAGRCDILAYGHALGALHISLACPRPRIKPSVRICESPRAAPRISLSSTSPRTRGSVLTRSRKRARRKRSWQSAWRKFGLTRNQWRRFDCGKRCPQYARELLSAGPGCRQSRKTISGTPKYRSRCSVNGLLGTCTMQAATNAFTDLPSCSTEAARMHNAAAGAARRGW